MTDAAIVTGAAGAIGQAIVGRLADAGFPVLLVDRDEAVHDLAAQLGDDRAAACAADLGGEDPAKAVVAALDERGWRPRVLVNNAGINRDARAAKMEEADFAAVIRVDLVGPARLAEELRPHMPDGSAIGSPPGRRSAASARATTSPPRRGSSASRDAWPNAGRHRSGSMRWRPGWSTRR